MLNLKQIVSHFLIILLITCNATAQDQNSQIKQSKSRNGDSDEEVTRPKRAHMPSGAASGNNRGNDLHSGMMREKHFVAVSKFVNFNSLMQ